MPSNPRLIEMDGEQFGRWTVVAQRGNTKGGGALWLCLCSCGQERVVLGSDLRNGKSESCGCLKNERIANRSRTHSSSGTRLHNIWKGMRSRCNSPANPKYYAYGERGITVCDEWGDFSAFKVWALSNGYADDLTIERVDVNGNYEPKNCTWADVNTQAANRRNTYVAPDGELWLHKAIRNGIKGPAFRRRIHEGWPPDEAATVPMWTRRTERNRDVSGRYS